MSLMLIRRIILAFLVASSLLLLGACTDEAEPTPTAYAATYCYAYGHSCPRRTAYTDRHATTNGDS